MKSEKEDIMMKVAIPTFGDRVSPRFDCAKTFLIVTLQRDEIAGREELSAADWAPRDRINRLVDLGVDTVICGGIDRWSADSLLRAGIGLHGWISGSIAESLDSLRHGELQATAGAVGEAPCGRRQGQRRGHRRGEAPRKLSG
jgi:predicted Fe-Mo cluster-binding NifX family protein